MQQGKYIEKRLFIQYAKNLWEKCMKKILCCAMAAVMAVFALCCVACTPDALQKAAAQADDYTIVCSYDNATHTLSAVQTMQLCNRSDNSFSAVKLHLFANQYRKDAANGVVPASYKAIAFPNGESFGDITVDSAKVDGQAVPFVVEGEDADILSVPLEKEWFPNDKVTLELAYTVQLANIKHRLGWTDNTVNLGNFFPIVCHVEQDNFDCTPYFNIGDPFVSEVANFDVTLKIDSSFVVASSGNLQEAASEGQFVTYRYTAEAVRDFAFVCSDKYKKISRTENGVTINYFYFADNDSENTLALATEAFAYFCQKVGAYPYKQLSICETEFCYGGMEYPSLVMVTTATASYLQATVHEVAHQWFYAVVGNDQIRHAWMDEGLAEFLTCLFLDHANIASLQQSIKADLKAYTTYVDVLNNFYNEADTTFRSLEQFKNDNEYVVMTYIKGNLLFATLHETMGEEKFWRALCNYYKDAAFCIAPPSQMTQCFAKVGGEEIATIFANFAEGKEILGKVTD